MSKAFKLVVLNNNSSELIVNSNKAIELMLNKKKQAYVSFGNKKHYVDVKMSDTKALDSIYLSQNIINELLLPIYNMYEVQVIQNEIILGPCIGLLFKNEDKALNEAYLKKMLIYVRDYSKLNGAIIVFALDKVDSAKLLIEGYCYNPISSCWHRGIFPYPCAVYRIIGLDAWWKNHFLSVIGDKTFNNRYFNKRMMHEWFSDNPSIKKHLPYTILYKSPQDIPDMISEFKDIYIKPVSGLKGRGIVKISKKGESLIFKYREGGKNQIFELDYFNGLDNLGLGNLDELLYYIQEHFHFQRRKYLIQESIELLQYEGGIVDFRCVLQKNQSNNWEFMAMFGRCGEKESIVSNISSGGSVFEGNYLLKKALEAHKTAYKIDFNSIMRKIHRLAIDVCSLLDEFGFNYGVLGLDIGVDINGHIWLIEINNRDPCMVYALDIDDEELYYKLKINPMYYAKALANFKL